jgi:hypothetical protein
MISSEDAAVTSVWFHIETGIMHMVSALINTMDQKLARTFQYDTKQGYRITLTTGLVTVTSTKYIY